jgi:hypothetical protein
MALLKKPHMSTTLCGFPDMLVARLLLLRKMDESPKNEAWARDCLDKNGLTILNLGDPMMGTAEPDEDVVNEMVVTLRKWT